MIKRGYDYFSPERLVEYARRFCRQLASITQNDRILAASLHTE